jgi:hypothetical protein
MRLKDVLQIIKIAGSHGLPFSNITAIYKNAYIQFFNPSDEKSTKNFSW